MGNLIKMDFYRLFQSKTFRISILIMFLLQTVTSFILPLAQRLLLQFADASEKFQPVESKLSEILCSPMMSLYMIIMFVSATTFLFADIRNGFIKNYAGQISRKGYSAISKFIVVCIHNLFFMLVAMAGSILGNLICPDATFTVDAGSGSAVIIFFVKLMLSWAMTSILLFLTTGLQNKTLASVIGVLFSVGALGLIYMGLDHLLSMAGVKISISNYVPDQLYNASYDLAAFGAVINAVVVSIIFIAVFVGMTVVIFNKRDVK